MGLLCDYFVAPSDDAAAATIDRDGGPGSTVATPRPQRRGGLLRQRVEPVKEAGPVEAYPTVDAKGIDPVVQMGMLEALLTGRTYDDVVEAQPGNPVAVRNGGERVVVKLSDGLTAALAGASNDDLVRVADPWSKTEEFWGDGDPVVLAGALLDLAGLARLAVERDQALYCWLSV
ncbi:hypothetical protein [Oerskovia paurometabola]|uniref:Uncharacterized protein n=1 Tax=Oerskovia paurometabola TaxID=162170 RepID=A0ABW1XCC0_9CELL|nr:hypothetical protein [Oerskovia paurometabola]MBM7496756.1 hypothetical protein [Oerskovia paurometabola]